MTPIKEKIIKLKIMSFDDRQNIVTALANSGYKVWVKEEDNGAIEGTDYYVYFEL